MRKTAWIGTLLFPLALAACDSGERAAGEAARDTRQAARQVGEAAGDAAVATKVKAALAVDEAVSATSIDVDAANGFITLTGNVPNREAADRAARIARSVEGVRGVNNRLTTGASG